MNACKIIGRTVAALWADRPTPSIRPGRGLKTTLVGGLLFLTLLSPGRAALLAYEGFGYVAGANLQSLNGGTGWNGGWVNLAGDSSVTGGSLLAGSNSPFGYDARSSGNSAFVNSSSRAGRWLDCSATGGFGAHGFVDGNGHIGADGKTLYVSFLQQPGATIKFYEFEFHRGDLGDPGRIGGIGNDFNSTTVNLRAPNSTQTPLGPGSTNVSFYVLRIDFKAGNDDVCVYRNPTGNAEADNEPVLTMPVVADMSFDGISLAAFLNGDTVKHDEIRLGETWGDVLGGPPMFVVQPANQTAYAGQTAVLTALAQSLQPSSYQWYRGGQLLSGQTNASLTLPALQLSEADHYSVVAANALGMATSAVATLTVQLIGVSIPTQSLFAGSGSNLVITSTVAGAPPVSLQWFKDGTALAGATNSTLAVGSTDFFDSGQYFLVANNALGSATSSVVNVFADLGAILAYEGFDYSPGSDLTGQNGGLGWSGAWANLGGGSANILSGSLSAGTNEPAGFDAHSAGGAAWLPNNSRKGRYLDCAPGGGFGLHGLVDARGNIGADGKTLYVSFLQQPDGPQLFYEFEFHRGDLGDPGRIAGIGNDTGAATVNFRAPDGTQNSLGLGSTNVNFYVVRIDFKPGNDDVFVYRNPTGTNEAANSPALTMLGVGDLSFNGISFGAYLNNRTVKHDEVRLGLRWADVLGNSVSQLEMTQRLNSMSRLHLAGSPNFAYQLQVAPEATGPWTNFARIVMPAIGISEVVETNGPATKRFYRAEAEPVLPPSVAGGTLLAGFDGADYGDWVTTGTAFGAGPAQGALPNQSTVSGYQGAGFADSYHNGDSSTGTLTSPPFTITASFITFLLGGGNYPGLTCLNLLVSNAIVRTATGLNAEALMPGQFDVSAYLGQTARFQIVDNASGSWGHVNVDQIVMTDLGLPALSRQLVLTNALLNLPVKNGATSRRVTVTVGGQAVRDFNIQLADGTPDWWSFVDVSAFQGQTATVTVNSLPPGSTGLSSVVQANGIVGATNLYAETLRPQVHFTSKRGWLNDANGMVYYQGLYHLYYQHDPFNWDGSGQKWWGHAVSPDMVQWQEWPEGIYSHAYGDDVWSGSMVVDSANTSGFKTGTNDLIVAAYYSTARGECMAYSNDRGLTYTDYPGNPVVVHATVGRDPHLFWYAPSNYWVMAVYDEAGGGGISFYSSPNLRQWTYHSKIFGFFECPDLFQLPVDGDTNNMQWLVCDASSGYLLGQFDGATFTPNTAKLPGHSGSAFYASQTFTTMPVGDTRRVRMGWAQIALPGMPFNQLMYFPTELKLRTLSAGVRLCSEPVAEVTNLIANEYAWTSLTLPAGYNPLSGIRGTRFNLQTQFAPGKAQRIDFTFQGLTASYNPVTQQITCNGITNPLSPVNGVVQLQILTDRNTIEIFGNQGQLYMPLPASYPATNGLISLTCSGGTAVINSLTVDKLKSAWPKP